jgi:hypothetical protein
MGTKPGIPVKTGSRRLARGVAAFRCAAIEVLDAAGQPRGWTLARRRPCLRQPNH